MTNYKLTDKHVRINKAIVNSMSEVLILDVTVRWFNWDLRIALEGEMQYDSN